MGLLRMQRLMRLLRLRRLSRVLKLMRVPKLMRLVMVSEACPTLGWDAVLSAVLCMGLTARSSLGMGQRAAVRLKVEPSLKLRGRVLLGTPASMRQRESTRQRGIPVSGLELHGSLGRNLRPLDIGGLEPPSRVRGHGSSRAGRRRGVDTRMWTRLRRSRLRLRQLSRCGHLIGVVPNWHRGRVMSRGGRDRRW